MSYLKNIEDLLHANDIFPSEDVMHSIADIINAEFDSIIEELGELSASYAGVASGIIVSNKAAEYIETKKDSYSLISRG